ncbi:hypothetical protein ACFQ1E_17545 [Sphingomonas canadensis]|uniref:Uncharacterized protein n=1 Tax=Sphingomonas canadensis TaxID=1219257 RepID=A0ABW3H9M1_9SPHN|nr:hypothetical protein [Sphingomonas canadensis]MCW3837852.1 hypothetical protein [Sphingomonas canadensis]
MSARDDWAPGDLAVCVADPGDWSPLSGAGEPGPRPVRGQVFRVVAIVPFAWRPRGWLRRWRHGVALCLRGKPAHRAWDAAGFRKIRPADPRFARQLRERLSPGAPARPVNTPTFESGAA